MPAPTNRAIVVGASTVAVAVLLVAAVGAVTGDGVASAAHETGDHPDWIHEENHTVQFTSHKPGEEAGMKVWASLPEDDRYGAGLEEYRIAANYAPAAFTDGADSEEDVPCSREDLKTGGVDRGANLSGTKIDESVVSNIKNYWIDETDDGQLYIMVETYAKDDFGGEHLSLNYTDQVVVVTGECFTNPEQTGWYRIGSYSNGTTWQGNYLEGAGYSHYFYICDCEDREEAIEKLGPPPVEGYGHEGSRVYMTGAELDNGPPDSWDLQDLREPNANEDRSGSASETATPAASSPTATPTGGGDDSGGGSGPDSDGGGASPATSTPSDPAGGAEPTASEAPGGDSGGSSQPGTPTASEGPGFGGLVALAGLLACTFLLYRRR